MAKKITMASIEKAMEAVRPEDVELICGDGEEAATIQVRRSLSLSERSSMVQDIAEMVFHEGKNGEILYAPYLQKIAIDFNILNYFTNVALTNNANRVWEFVDKTDIVASVIDAVGNRYIQGIIKDADELISFKKDQLLRKSKLDGVLDAVTDLMKTFKEKTSESSIGDIVKRVQEANPEFNIEEVVKAVVNESLGEVEQENSNN